MMADYWLTLKRDLPDAEHSRSSKRRRFKPRSLNNDEATCNLRVLTFVNAHQSVYSDKMWSILSQDLFSNQLSLLATWTEWSLYKVYVNYRIELSWIELNWVGNWVFFYIKARWPRAKRNRKKRSKCQTLQTRQQESQQIKTSVSSKLGKFKHKNFTWWRETNAISWFSSTKIP